MADRELTGKRLKVNPPASPETHNIRIIGDKAAGKGSLKSESSDTVLKIQSTDTMGRDQERPAKEAEHKRQIVISPAAQKAEDERKTAAKKAEEERLAKEAEQKRQLEISLAAQKAEEERKAAAKKAEEERLAKEAEHKRQLELSLAAQKAEEERKAAAKKAEEERLAKEAEHKRQLELSLAAQKAEEERKAAAKKAEEERLAKEAEYKRQLELNLAAQKAEEERKAAAKKAEENRLGKEVGQQEHPAMSPVPQKPEAEQKLAEGTSSSSITIWDLYQSAKDNDPALGRTEARVTSSKADSDVLLSGLMPHLDSSAGVRAVSQTLYNYAPDTIKDDYKSLNYSITARMTLLHVPTFYSLAATAASLRVEHAGVAAARQNLIVKFLDSYFALLKAQVDKDIASGEINRLKQVLEQSQAFLKAGTGDIIAVYEAQSRLDGANADLTRSGSNLRLAEQKLASVVGKPVSSIADCLPQQPKEPEPDDPDWWVTTMEREHPAVQQAREGVILTSEQKKAVKAEFLPILQASGGYDVNRGTAALPTAEVRQWFVGASLTLPLYSGGETSAKIRRAVASEQERRHAFDETMNLQRENVKQAFFNLRYNISLIKALGQRRASAEVQLSAVTKGRKIGTRTAIDLLNAEQTYSMSLRDYRNALYDNVMKSIQLKAAAGILTDADVFELAKSVVPPKAVTLTN